MKKREPKTETPQRDVSFLRLAGQAIPEMWTYQILSAIVLALPATFLTMLISTFSQTDGAAFTSSNIKMFVLSWRFPVLLVLGSLLALIYIVVEVFTQIHLCGMILKGQRTSFRRELLAGIRSVRRFLNPGGFSIILFILFAVPLCGIGMSVSLTRAFYIPNFIMDTIFATPLYLGIYCAGMAVLFVNIFRWLFALHAVILDDLSPKEAKKRSAGLIKKNWKNLLLTYIKVILVIFLIQVAVFLVVKALPEAFLEEAGRNLPRGHVIEPDKVFEAGALTEMEWTILGYRFLCILEVLMSAYLTSVAILLGSSYLILRLTRSYMEYTEGSRELWPERPEKARYSRKVLLIIGVFVLAVLVAAGGCIVYNPLFTPEHAVHIVAHRAGGTLAAENSNEGLEKAIEYGCYGSEIDVQRTKDSYYIINHDNTFKRVAGEKRAAQEMTLDEIEGLRIRTGGMEAKVPRMEEQLDIIKGREKLFIELKGATADRQMADDLVRMVREKDCVDDVVMISLKYNVINYLEKTYPEFETGILIYGALGKVAALNCDVLIMEEEMATENRINDIHDAGKKAIVWTVNKKEGMYHFLNSRADAVITDQVERIQKVQAELADRTDLEVISDRLETLWKSE